MLTPLLLLALSGCAPLPIGPSVNVLPTQGKPFEQFQREDGTCRSWAEKQLGNPQQASGNEVATGAVAGTAIGAGLGAMLGSVSHQAGTGAAIGAVSGLLVGSAVGSNAGQINGAEAQRRYDNAYLQCMYSYGNQIPGRRVAVAAPPRVVAPPPPPVAPPPVVMSAPPPPAPAVVAAPPQSVVAPPQAYYDAPPADYAAPPQVVTAPPAGAEAAQYYPAPPEVYVSEAPQFIYSPQLGMYVAVGVPYDLVFDGREYYYFHGGRWYRGPYYDGPWGFVSARAYPTVFVRYRIDGIRRFREAEFRRYQHDREHFNGRFHRPAFRERHARKDH